LVVDVTEVQQESDEDGVKELVFTQYAVTPTLSVAESET
jgi:hypothetical protein